MKKILYSGLDNIGDVVNSIVKRTDLQNGIQKSMLFKFWGKIVGKKFKKITRPVSINNNGELIVACANSMVTSELLLFKTDIQKKMLPYTKSLDINISDIVFSHKIWKEEKNENSENPENINTRQVSPHYNDFNPDEIELDEAELSLLKASVNKNTFATAEQRKKMLTAIINDLKYQKFLKNLKNNS